MSCTPIAAPRPAAACVASARSAANSVRPMDPSGTSPSSMTPPDSRSQTMHPRPTPSEKTVSSSVTTCSSPPRTSCPSPGNCASATAPKNQNHEMPRIDRNTECVSRATPIIGQVSRIGFQRMRMVGSSAGASGIECATIQPASAIPITVAETTAGPLPGIAKSTPPRMVPSRIARNVPSSTRALPATSSVSSRCCGRMLYFTGPNSVECTPIMKSAPSRMVTLRRWKPTAPTHMIAISRSLTARMMRPFSKRAESCPEVAEKRKNGRMKMPPARLINVSVEMAAVAVPNANRMTSAFLNRLSFSAPRNCVQKNGANRRARSRATWLTGNLAAVAAERAGLLVRSERREHCVELRLCRRDGGVRSGEPPEPRPAVALDDRREQPPARLVGAAGAAHRRGLVRAPDVHRRLLEAVDGADGHDGGILRRLAVGLRELSRPALDVLLRASALALAEEEQHQLGVLGVTVTVRDAELCRAHVRRCRDARPVGRDEEAQARRLGPCGRRLGGRRGCRHGDDESEQERATHGGVPSARRRRWSTGWQSRPPAEPASEDQPAPDQALR